MNVPMGASSAPTIFEGVDAETALAGLGLRLSHLHAALAAGEVGAGNIDEYHPPTAAGTVRWHETVGQLRRGLQSDLDWRLKNVLNSPRTVRPDGVVTVMAVGGTADTGLRAGHPLAARRKGAATRQSIAAGQTAIEITLSASAPDPAQIGNKRDTWVLLYYRDRDPNQLRAELSLAASVENGQFTGWVYRILLPTLPFDPGAEVLPNDAGGSDVTFEITAVG